MRIRKITLAIALGFSSLLASAQAPAIQWDKTIGGSDLDNLTSIKQTTDGGYILGGRSNSGISGDKTQANWGTSSTMDYWVVKTDATGNKFWDKTFGGSDTDELHSLIQTQDGGYLLGGWTLSGISGNKSSALVGMMNYWVVKLDANGNKIWDKTIGGNYTDRLTNLLQMQDGSYVLGGYSSSGIAGNKTQASKGLDDFWIVKLDVNGNIIWDKTLGGNGYDELYSLMPTSDGGFIAGGRSNSGLSGDKSLASFGSYDYWVIKLDAGGNKLWDKSFGGSTNDELYSLTQTSDGGYLIGGRSNSVISGSKTQAPKGSYDYWVIKLDASGNKVWERTLGGSGSEKMNSLIQMNSGDYLVGGFSESGISGDKTQTSNGSGDYWIVKLDATGNQLWDKTVGAIGSDWLTSLAQTTDGGFILGGETTSGLSGDKTGSNKGGWDCWIVKLGPDAITGIQEPGTSFNLTVSPNPSQGKFALQLSGINSPKAVITVANLIGQIILQQELPVKNKQVSEEIAIPEARGVYLLQVKAGNQIKTQKLVVR